MKFKEMKQAVNLLYNEWNLGKKESGASGNICAWIYLMEILEESEKIVTYKENNKLIGFCGYSKNTSKRYKIRKKFYHFLKQILYKSRKIKNVKALKHYYENYSYSPKELENNFDGEISILIVDKNYRGKNIGKELLLETFKKAEQDGLEKIQILSDESCNYKFYENCGCTKIYETLIENEEYGNLGNIQKEKAYIYEKNLK